MGSDTTILALETARVRLATASDTVRLIVELARTGEQKTMGLIWLMLISARASSGDHLPYWVVASCYTSMALGTLFGGRLFGVKKVFPARTEQDRQGEPFTPRPELCDIARRCGRAFGIDLYSVDIIESEGKPYVVDMSSIPGCAGVPDAPQHLASYLIAAAERAAQGSRSQMAGVPA